MGTSLAEPDVIVVGGGPAGMAAAVAAAGADAQVVLLDAGHGVGGQYWRRPNDPGLAEQTRYVQHDGRTWRRLVEALDRLERAGRLVRHARHEVWAITRTVDQAGASLAVHAIDRAAGVGGARTYRAAAVVLAPGAYDRQLPFPGWDLPGVMAAGGAQALLKGSGTLPGRRVLVAGSGPFLLPVATGLARAGAQVLGVHEAAGLRGWLSRPHVLASTPGKLAEGAGYAATFLRRRIAYHPRSAVVRAHGGDRLEGVTVAALDQHGRVRPDTERTVGADTLAVGWGFTPQLELPLALGCRTRTDVDGSLVVVVDDQQRTSVPGVFVAGEACGVGGAALAVVEGQIAGEAAAQVPLDGRLLGRRRRLAAFARAMHAAYALAPGWVDRVGQDSLLCRCEEVTVGDLYAALDAHPGADLRAAKHLTRVAMGWCQGRVCGFAAAGLVTQRTGQASQLLAVSTRPVASPVTLGALAEEAAAATVPEPPQPPQPAPS